jgi:hypothetical protein
MGKEQRASHLAPHLEVFAKAVAEGSSHVQAAVICERSRGSASDLYARPGVRERIAEFRAAAAKASEKAVAENATLKRRRVDVERNEIIMCLADIARSETEPAAVRIRAWAVLSRIFMLEAKTLNDLKQFYGWNSDELEEYDRSGRIPRRFRPLLDDGSDEAGESEEHSEADEDKADE